MFWIQPLSTTNLHDEEILEHEAIRVPRQYPASNSILQTAKTQASISRRAVLTGLGAVGLGGVCGCASSLDMPDLGLDNMTTGAIRPHISVDQSVTSPDLMYASFADSGFQLPKSVSEG
jgi:hypothetical protein